MTRRPPRSTRTATLFPTRRSSDLTGVFPSDARKIFDFLGSTDKQLELIKGAHYFEDSIEERQNAADLVGAWIREKLQMAMAGADIIADLRGAGVVVEGAVALGRLTGGVLVDAWKVEKHSGPGGVKRTTEHIHVRPDERRVWKERR